MMKIRNAGLVLAILPLVTLRLIGLQPQPQRDMWIITLKVLCSSRRAQNLLSTLEKWERQVRIVAVIHASEDLTVTGDPDKL